MEYQGTTKILNATGQSVNFVGGFLLTVEAIRVARIANLAQSLEEVSKVVTSPTGGTPLPLRWYFAIACATFSGAVWLFAPYLLLFTITPTLFVAVFVLHRFLSWSIKLSTTGYIGIVGFAICDSRFGFSINCYTYVVTNPAYSNLRKSDITLSELLPTVEQLSRQDKLRLIHFLLLAV
jgi:hypothetical protein